MDKKSREAFRTISEVADWLDTPTHVLRFWESRFTQVKPVKRAGGRRYYRPNDMLLLGGIKKLLHEDGMTIRGVQKLLREEGIKHVSAMSQPVDADQDPATQDLATEGADIEATVAEAPMAVDVEPQPLQDNVVTMRHQGASDDLAGDVDTEPVDDTPAEPPTVETTVESTPEDLPSNTPTTEIPSNADLLAREPGPETTPQDAAADTGPLDAATFVDDGAENRTIDGGLGPVSLGDDDTALGDIADHTARDTPLDKEISADESSSVVPPVDTGQDAVSAPGDVDQGGFDFNAPEPLLDEDDPAETPRAEAPFSPAMDDADRDEPAVAAPEPTVADDPGEETPDAQSPTEDAPDQPVPAVARVDVPDDPAEDADLGGAVSPVAAALHAGAAQHAPQDALERAMDKLRALRARM